MQTKYQIEMAKTLLADITTSLDEERSQSSQKIANYRKLVTQELPKLLHKDFGIPLNKLPSTPYLEAICEICETTN